MKEKTHRNNMEKIMQKDDQREGMSKASKDMPDHTGGEDKSEMRNKDQSCPTKGGTVQESKTKPNDILDEVESPEEDHHPPYPHDLQHPLLLCVIPQCRHWRDLDIEYPDLGRCVLDNAIIRQKTFTVCSDENTRHTARWWVFECQGFEWHDRYAEEDVTWVAVAELPEWPEGPRLDLEAIAHVVRRFTLTRGTPVEDPTDETTEEVSEVIPKEEPASNVIEFPGDLSRR